MPTKPVNDRYLGETYPDSGIFPGITTPVARLTPAQQEAARIYVDAEGRLRWARNGSLVDTSDSRTHFSGARVIFIMDDQGNFYASPNQRVGRFHHSSLAMGKPVAAAGELEVHAGRLQVLTNQSGHYRPTPEMTHRAVLALLSQGMRAALAPRADPFDTNLVIFEAQGES